MTAGATVVRAVGGGTVGAVALTALHELTRRTVPRAPRMDVIGMRALSRTVRALGGRPARGDRLFRQTLLGDLAANTLYYSLAATGRRPLSRGLLLGLAAGIGAAALPPLMGLGRSPGARWPATPLMTIALYTAGGLAAGAAGRALTRTS
ncbi:MAG TPA: hypothetical protein VHG35_13040 [Gemmatimonadales bacterium]|nr:hypothetical protein [Gemmatimonadales bacterium]